MALNLKDMMKRAEDKGIKPSSHSPSSPVTTITKPWQQESVLIPLEAAEHKEYTNGTQSQHKEYTNGTHELNQKTQTVHKEYTQRYTRADTNGTQRAHKRYTILGFSALIGIQREVTIFIYRSCQKERSHISETLSLDHMASTLNIRKGSIKTTIIRLEEKGIIHRSEVKTGRGGWSKFEIENGVFQEILQLETAHKLDTNGTQTVHKANTQRYTEEYTSLSSSSSINKTTTGEETEDNQKELLPDGGDFNLKPEWAEVDISPLAFIGFSKHHLIQIIRQGKLTPDLVQDSIYAYAFDLQINERGKGINSPINFIMGILRKGMPYTPPDNYASPRQQAINKILEARKREKEAELAMLESDFQLWLEKTPRDKKAELAGDIFGMAYDEKNPMILAKLREKWSNLLG